MSSLDRNQVPKTRPMQRNRGALVASLDIGTSKIACMIARLRPSAPNDALRGRTHAVELIGYSQIQSRGMKAGAVTDLAQCEQAVRQAVSLAEQMAKVRVESVLLPLSAGEIRGRREDFVDRAFAGGLLDHRAEALTRTDYAQAVTVGGFPEVALGPATTRFRSSWCDSYLRTVTAVANVEQVAEIRRPQLIAGLVEQLAARSSGEVVVADLARELNAGAQLVTSYLDVLATLYLIRLLPAWTTSRINRSKRRPVVHMIDSALAAHLVGETVDDLARPGSRWFGPLLESYVVGEIAKQAAWAERPVALSHYRDRDQREVDLVLERGREVVAVEVKATSTPAASHARHLAYLRDRIGDRFRGGIVLHTGNQRVPLGDRLCAVPVSSLWA